MLLSLLLVAAALAVLLTLVGCGEVKGRELLTGDGNLTGNQNGGDPASTADGDADAASTPMTIANTLVDITSVSDSMIVVTILPPAGEYFPVDDANEALPIVRACYLLDAAGNQTELEGGRMTVNWNIRDGREDGDNVKSVELEFGIPEGTKNVKAQTFVCGEYQIPLAGF
jgi:hypothetical protein